MKVFRLLINSLALIFVFTILAFAQTETPQNSAPNKIAAIDTKAFENETNGIKEVVEAYDKLEAELKPQAENLNLLTEKILKLEKEINDFQSIAEKIKGICVPDNINKKIEEYDKLTKEYKQKQDALKSLYDKRKAEIFADIYRKVSDAIKQFSKENGYLMIIDVSKDNSSVIIEGETIDVTKEFIKYYNENFAKSKSQ